MSSRLRDAKLCTTWMWSNNSNVHVAKDRGWFIEYHPFSTYIGSPFAPGTLVAIGVGVVEIPVKKSPHRTGSNTHATLRLTNVLHVPTYTGNIIAAGCTEKYFTIPRYDNYEQLLNASQQRIALVHRPKHLEKWGIPELVLSGYPKGPKKRPAPFRKEVAAYYLAPIWPPEERKRFMLSQGPMEQRIVVMGAIIETKRLETGTGSQPDRYTSEEKAWLKENWGNEYRFLQAHGLSIYREEDRDKGADMVRSLMTPEDDEKPASKSEPAFNIQEWINARQMLALLTLYQ